MFNIYSFIVTFSSVVTFYSSFDNFCQIIRVCDQRNVKDKNSFQGIEYFAFRRTIAILS